LRLDVVFDVCPAGHKPHVFVAKMMFAYADIKVVSGAVDGVLGTFSAALQ